MDVFKLSRNELIYVLDCINYDPQFIRDNLSSYNLKGKAIIISDTHLGSVEDNLDYIRITYNFARQKRIKNIIHTGDILEGMCKSDGLSYNQQIDYLLDNYPNRYGINTYFIDGNHDYKFLKKGYDINTILTRERDDFHFIGIGKGYIKLNDSLFFLSHKIDKYHLNIPVFKFDCAFKGHSHFYEESNNDGPKTYTVPTLSNDKFNHLNKSFYNDMPGFLIVNDDDLEVRLVNIDNDRKLIKHK